jgi:hypothetical protein
VLVEHSFRDLSSITVSTPGFPGFPTNDSHQNNDTSTAININKDSDDALFVSGGSGDDPSRSNFDSNRFDDARGVEDEGEESLEEEQTCELREIIGEVDGVEFLARWRVFCGKQSVRAKSVNVEALIRTARVAQCQL